MRYSPAENLLRLVRHLAAMRAGRTLDEIAAELGVGRRTVERMRDTNDGGDLKELVCCAGGSAHI